MSLSLVTERLEDAAVVYCRGRIVFREEANTLSDAASDLLAEKQTLVLHLGEVEAVDSAGMGTLVLLHLWAKESRRHLKLTDANDRVRNMLQLTGLSGLFEIHDSVEEALREKATA